MLRISNISTSPNGVTLLLEGHVGQQTTDIVREAVAVVLAQGQSLTLDLSGVLFADRSGLALLRELQQRQVTLLNSSPYLKEQLKDTAAV